jgi:hypothetical protein
MVRKISLERILAERYGDITEDGAKYKDLAARREWRKQYMKKYRKAEAHNDG